MDQLSVTSDILTLIIRASSKLLILILHNNRISYKMKNPLSYMPIGMPNELDRLLRKHAWVIVLDQETAASQDSLSNDHFAIR